MCVRDDGGKALKPGLLARYFRGTMHTNPVSARPNTSTCLGNEIFEMKNAVRFLSAGWLKEACQSECLVLNLKDFAVGDEKGLQTEHHNQVKAFVPRPYPDSI